MRITIKHKTIIRAIVIEGLTARQAAEKFNIDYEHLTVLRRAKAWVLIESEIEREVFLEDKLRMQAFRTKALDAVAKGLISTDERVAQAAARDVLDRTGMIKGIAIEEKVERGVDGIQDDLISLRKQKEELFKEHGITEEEFFDQFKDKEVGCEE